MGYMGLGMQNWVYKMKPRKPYSMERKESFTPVPNYRRTFKLQHSKKSSKLDFLLPIVLIIIFFGIVFLMKPRFVEHSNRINIAKYERNINKDIRAYNLLVKIGKGKLSRNLYHEAYLEFKTAYKLYPNNEEIIKLHTETLSVLCNQEIKYCKELNTVLDNTIKVPPF